MEGWPYILCVGVAYEAVINWLVLGVHAGLVVVVCSEIHDTVAFCARTR